MGLKVKRLTSNWSVIIIGLLFMASCRKNYVPDVYRGKVQAKRDGTEWKGHPFVSWYGVDIRGNTGVNFTFSRFTPEGYLRDRIYIFRVPDKTGNYVIDSVNPVQPADTILSANYILDDSEQPGDEDFYIIGSEDTTSHIWIDEYDVGNGKIKGRFKITFVIDRSQPKNVSTHPDTIRFTEGFYKSKVYY